MYSCQQNLISNQEILPFLEYLCTEANNLTNCGVYLARQLYLKTNYIVGSYDLEKNLKQNLHFQFLYSQASQQILRSVAFAFASFKALNKLFYQGKIKDKPKLPKYRKSGGLALITYPKQALKLKDNQIRISLGKKVKASFGIDCFYLPMPTNLIFNSIKELRIVPRNGCFYAEFVYQKPDFKTNLNKSNVLGIDHGLDNWLSCVSNIGKSFIIDGKKVKSQNQWYNKQVANLKKDKPHGFWNEELAFVTEKRNRQMRDNINKTASFLISWCCKNNVMSAP